MAPCSFCTPPSNHCLIPVHENTRHPSLDPVDHYMACAFYLQPPVQSPYVEPHLCRHLIKVVMDIGRYIVL